MARITGQTWKEWGCFAALLVSMHYAYYTIQNNPSLVAPHERQELFYIRWVKEQFPALKSYGVQEEGKDLLKRLEEEKKSH
ncbi:unnamed protein product [Auanema sp. JU1783]|nr:unnamed protein product [Auanema sp. JU1783]